MQYFIKTMNQEKKKEHFNWRIKNQLDTTCYFIVLLIGSTCFGHYYAHHQELTTILLNYHIGRIVLGSMCVGDSVWFDWSGIRVAGCSLQPGHYSSLTTPKIQHTANQERNDQCDNQHHSREVLMMGIVMPETYWAYKKYNKITSGI